MNVLVVPLSMGFSRQEHWSGLPFPSPGDVPDPGIEPGSPAFRADSLPSELPKNPKHFIVNMKYIYTLIYKEINDLLSQILFISSCNILTLKISSIDYLQFSFYFKISVVQEEDRKKEPENRKGKMGNAVMTGDQKKLFLFCFKLRREIKQAKRRSKNLNDLPLLRGRNGV